MRDRLDAREAHRGAVHDAQQLERQRRIALDRLLHLSRGCLVVAHQIQQLQRARLRRRQIALHHRFRLAVEVALEECESDRRARGAHRLRLYALRKQRHTERSQLGNDRLQLLRRFPFHIHLHHVGQLEQRHPLLIPREVVQCQLIAALSRVRTRGDHVCVWLHMLKNLEHHRLRVEQLPRALDDQVA